MSKGQVSAFIGLYSGILTDIGLQHPTLIAGLDRDLIRLTALMKDMGERVFTLLLPALGKGFDQSLEAGRLVVDGLDLSGRVSSRVQIPRLFGGLWMRIFQKDGCLRQDVDPADVFYMRTLLFACKKYRSDCTPQKVYETIAEYYDVDTSLPPPTHFWDGDGSDLIGDELGHLSDLSLEPTDLFASNGDQDGTLLDRVQHVADRVSLLLGEYVPSEAAFRHGPGAVADLRTGAGYKYQFPSWSPRLQFVFPADVFATANGRNQGSEWDESAGLPLKEVASRLITVPKTQKGPRLIAAEPTCHQWCQQSVRDFLSDRIRATVIGRSIDFGRQDLSGDLALSASLKGDLATVDLSAASDRLSCWLVQRIFRKNIPLLSAMVACRTRYVSNEIDVKSPTLHKLRKFSSMGSALTFPVQSLVFYVICVAAGLSLKGPKANADSDWQECARQVRVYGDDLIVPVEWMPRVEYLLARFFLKVNRTKTFSVGNFRESCGTDAFRGVNVSPGQCLEFYVESKPSSLLSAVEVSNNLFKKGLWHASASMLSAIPESIDKLIDRVRIGSGSFGLETSCGFAYKSRKRWNEDLQRWEHRAMVVKAKAKSAMRHEGFENLLQFFTEDPCLSGISTWESGVYSKPTPVIGRGWVRDE